MHKYVYSNFLITRINIKQPNHFRHADRNVNDKAFLAQRFNIFEKICIPSVISQSFKKFTWLILLDSGLPLLFKQKIEGYRKKYAIVPVYVEGIKFLWAINSIIKEYIPKETQYLISTNLDSDDALNKDFMAMINKYFYCQDFEFLVFPFGYLYRFGYNDLYLRYWMTPPIYTLIERVFGFKTCLFYGHTKVNEFKHKIIQKNPAWLMSVHETNDRTQRDINAIWQPTSRLCSDFNIYTPLKRDSFNDIKMIILHISQTLKNVNKRVNTPKKKLINIVGIACPSLLIFTRKISYKIRRFYIFWKKAMARVKNRKIKDL